jgi:rubrerythrin
LSDKPKQQTKEERDAADERMLDKIAEKVAAKLGPMKPNVEQVYPYSACPICGYIFISKEAEDVCDECPECDYTGETVKLHHDKTKK